MAKTAVEMCSHNHNSDNQSQFKLNWEFTAVFSRSLNCSMISKTPLYIFLLLIAIFADYRGELLVT